MEPHDFCEFGPANEQLVWRRNQVSSILPAAERAEEAELFEKLRRDLAILPSKQRESLLAQRRFGGNTDAIREVMRKYGCSDATVYNWAAKAFDRLKNRFEFDGY
jgi:DNA-directed RNA polymerase specialized sigma24 family protein